MTRESRQTKNAVAAVAPAVGGVVVLSTKHRPFAERQDFAIYGGLNGVCHGMSRNWLHLTTDLKMLYE